MKSLLGKRVLITGASSGIGAALAREFARRGADLVLVARRTDRLKTLASEIEAMGRIALALTGDVARDGDLEQAVAESRRKLGLLDIVVANAGFGVVGTFEKLTLDDYRRQFETNVYGVMRTLRATLADLKETRGCFAAVGSVNGHIALPGNSPYGMSKFAVRSWCESVRGEMARYGISVTHIAPGFINTEIFQVDNQGVHHPGVKAQHIPQWIMMPAATAARKIARAIVCRRRERIVTVHGHFFVWLNRLFPGLVSWIVLRGIISARREP